MNSKLESYKQSHTITLQTKQNQHTKPHKKKKRPTNWTNTWIPKQVLQTNTQEINKVEPPTHKATITRLDIKTCKQDNFLLWKVKSDQQKVVSAFNIKAV